MRRHRSTAQCRSCCLLGIARRNWRWRMAFSHQIIQNFAAPRLGSCNRTFCSLVLASVINWGGYLASEAFEFLLSVTTGDDDLRSLLWREHQAHLGFEDILAREREISVRPRMRGGAGRTRTSNQTIISSWLAKCLKCRSFCVRGLSPQIAD